MTVIKYDSSLTVITRHAVREIYFKIDIAHLVFSVSGHEFCHSFMFNSTYTLIYPSSKFRKACRVKAIDITLFYD